MQLVVCAILEKTFSRKLSAEIFFLPRMVGGPLFLQKIMYFELIVDGILLFVVRMALQKTFLKDF